ncbi:hypothetical protein PQ610_02120 [Tardisphaera miroshnichenkoae]
METSEGARPEEKAEVISIGVASVLLLDPDWVLFLRELRKSNYFTAEYTFHGEALSITWLEYPDVIARKAGIKIYYNMGRRTLGIQGSTAEEVLQAMEEVRGALAAIGVDIEKALIPCELVVVAQARIKPKLSDTSLKLRDLPEFNLVMTQASFSASEGDPNSNKWLQVSVQPIWSSYEPSARNNIYRLVVTFRDKREIVIGVLKKLDQLIEGLCEVV